MSLVGGGANAATGSSGPQSQYGGQAYCAVCAHKILDRGDPRGEMLRVYWPGVAQGCRVHTSCAQRTGRS